MLTVNKDMLSVNKHILFVNKDMLSVDKHILSVNKNTWSVNKDMLTMTMRLGERRLTRSEHIPAKHKAYALC